MTARLNLSEQAPATYKAMVHLSTTVDRNSSSIPAPLLDLLRLRVSQLNGCAYCVDMHTTDALAAGESAARVAAVAVWREAPCFDDFERAVLAFAESLTKIADVEDRVPDELWAATGKHVGDTGLAELVMAVTTINAWNRICVATRTVPDSFAAPEG
ncbi:carboxymuconolactone decarboxylase family protein [Tenggerimyces flavus]|uniref:Carboxymuconolactone decarboxylase family protein n=1 Tax=Tenggerimyces flavus TaxID=1708749 RepID=A0ABV7Y447_9ACTN|nr:carboxymuconolactone decarboxylase family protein [Tenggerimyces flavus]MBM7788401.1 AhpD family alkylhydroperoxidase [Tenggerimyces flavus]